MSTKNKVCYTKRRQAKVQSLGSCLENFLAQQKYKVNLVRLWQHWDFVLGSDLAELAIPLGHRTNILLIGAEDNLVMQELSYSSHNILALVNEFLEENYFQKIEFQLMQGRRALNTNPFFTLSAKSTMPEKPEKLGTLQVENPVYRAAYEAYVKAFAE